MSESISIMPKETIHNFHGAIIQEELSIEEKLQILTDAAKYDVACTSSGVERKGGTEGMGNAMNCGICHSFASDGRCVSLLKILYTNECIYDCKYCINRSSNDVKRATFTPDEVCTLTMEFYRRNYIEGLFLSSGIIESPDYTMDLLFQTLYKLRMEHHFNGYIHIKTIPGADAALIERIGYLADRMSINLELPTAEGLRKLAPHKNRSNILTPMKQIQVGIHNSRQALGMGRSRRNLIMEANPYGQSLSDPLALTGQHGTETILARQTPTSTLAADTISQSDSSWTLSPKESGALSRQTAFGTQSKYFVPAGQSTQMIIGATEENDYQLLTITENLYKQFDLKRVFYSAFIPVNEDSALPPMTQKPPLLREHRLYQADWLLRFYGFQAGELLSETQPNFNELIDPKCDWAVRHLEQFPMEIMKAGYYQLLRVPGIGVKSAKRIVSARKMGKLDFSDLRKMGVVLKRAQFFITCQGKMLYHIPFEEQFITNQLIYGEKPYLPAGSEITYKQPTLFDFGLQQA